MKIPQVLAITILVLNSKPVFGADIVSDHSIAGTWKGSLEILGKETPLIFSFDVSPNGQASGFLLSPTQTSEKIPLSQISLKDRDVKIFAKLLNGSFVGKLSPKSKRIKGDWSQGGFTLPLELEFSGEKLVVDRPQNPTGTPPYEVSEIRFMNKFGPHRLAGTFTVPKGQNRQVPAVVLVSGSGPQDRDETMFGHKPFWVLADHLTRKGIAVLRFDDRGVGESEGNFEEATHMDLATDAWAAVEFLSTRPEVDKSKIGIIGHGEGGLVAPIVATKREDITFLVLLAAPGVRGDQTILSQSRTLSEALALPQEFIDLNQDFSVALFEALQAQNPDLQRVQFLGAKFEAEAKKIANLKPEQMEGLKETMLRDLSMFEKPWFLNFIKHDPGTVLEQIKCPVLAINGDLDLQVPSKVHLPEIESHLKAGGNTKFEVHELKKHNHLFQRAETGVPAEYGKIDETISTQTLKMISDWITKQ